MDINKEIKFVENIVDLLGKEIEERISGSANTVEIESEAGKVKFAKLSLDKLIKLRDQKLNDLNRLKQAKWEMEQDTDEIVIDCDVLTIEE